MEAGPLEALCWMLLGAGIVYFVSVGMLHNLYRKSLQAGANEGQRQYRQALREIGSKFGISFKNGEWVQDNDNPT